MDKTSCDCVGLCKGHGREDDTMTCRLDEQIDSMAVWVCVCVDRTQRSDVLVFWGPDRKGYTYDLNKAGLYDSDESAEICEGGRHVRFTIHSLKKSKAAEIRIDKDRSTYHEVLKAAQLR